MWGESCQRSWLWKEDANSALLYSTNFVAEMYGKEIIHVHQIHCSMVPIPSSWLHRSNQIHSTWPTSQSSVHPNKLAGIPRTMTLQMSTACCVSHTMCTMEPCSNKSIGCTQCRGKILASSGERWERGMDWGGRRWNWGWRLRWWRISMRSNNKSSRFHDCRIARILFKQSLLHHLVARLNIHVNV